MVDDEGQQGQQGQDGGNGECLKARAGGFAATDLCQTVAGNDGFPVEGLLRLIIFVWVAVTMLVCPMLVHLSLVVHAGLTAGCRLDDIIRTTGGIVTEAATAIRTKVDALANLLTTVRTESLGMSRGRAVLEAADLWR